MSNPNVNPNPFFAFRVVINSAFRFFAFRVVINSALTPILNLGLGLGLGLGQN